ncbi:hypothetical protein T01_2385 [Trichinella spiralis]|uniref:Uncharacterized protein n=1 Tax=Trichinella spiralis TaxID=6334 RepID=A0A0V1BHP8_TRISP|nr:hypothetical protein T01_2385 [Trichinella spiralis]
MSLFGTLQVSVAARYEIYSPPSIIEEFTASFAVNRWIMDAADNWQSVVDEDMFSLCIDFFILIPHFDMLFDQLKALS